MIGGFNKLPFLERQRELFAHMACDFRETINVAAMWVQNNI